MKKINKLLIVLGSLIGLFGSQSVFADCKPGSCEITVSNGTAYNMQVIGSESKGVMTWRGGPNATITPNQSVVGFTYGLSEGDDYAVVKVTNPPIKNPLICVLELRYWNGYMTANPHTRDNEAPYLCGTADISDTGDISWNLGSL